MFTESTSFTLYLAKSTFKNMSSASTISEDNNLSDDTEKKNIYIYKLLTY